MPLYGTLVDLVASVDAAHQSANPTPAPLPTRHALERHGAIRLGTAHEMRLMARLFALLGMHPVGYYDLSVVDFPLHGTAFRPITDDALAANPFRVFTTVLRPDLISSPTVRQTATDILSRRRLFSARLIQIMDLAEASGPTRNLPPSLADELIVESLQVFKWHSRSTVPQAIYLALKAAHPMVADIVCFPSAHINHLTPRTLDIDAVQAAMVRQGLPAKEQIEGPPGGRKCEILLRQTSFKALEERVIFPLDGASDSNDAGHVNGTHTARFGEVEQRGAAVTPKGRQLYDRLLAEAIAAHDDPETESDRDFSSSLSQAFAAYPDCWTELRRQGLVYFSYRVVPQAPESRQEQVATIVHESPGGASGISMERLVSAGLVSCEAITYEDFLPFSTAGIFRSNLGDGGGSENRDGRLSNMSEAQGRAELEVVLGETIPSEFDIYERIQEASVKECEIALGLGRIVV